MERELSRQLIHLSGVLFVVVAQFIDKILLSSYFLLIAVVFLFYSQYVKSEQKRINQLLDKIEEQIRKVAIGLERKNAQRPFIGAFWFYFASAVTFLLFPLKIASSAVFILAVADSFSTIVGVKFGKHKIVGNKTIEGTFIFFISSFVSLVFISFPGAVLASIVATFSEILPDIKAFDNLKKMGFLDDNWTIPIITASILYALTFVLPILAL
jgi:dolichol kinase